MQQLWHSFCISSIGRIVNHKIILTMRKIKLLIPIFLTMIIVLSASAVFAQGPLPPPDLEIPIDGGLGLLIAAGIIYGAKKLQDNRDRVL